MIVCQCDSGAQRRVGKGGRVRVMVRCGRSSEAGAAAARRSGRRSGWRVVRPGRGRHRRRKGWRNEVWSAWQGGWRWAGQELRTVFPEPFFPTMLRAPRRVEWCGARVSVQGATEGRRGAAGAHSVRGLQNSITCGSLGEKERILHKRRAP